MNSALILLENSQGQYLVQIRSATDDSYPLHYDFSAGGGIDDGESSLEAAHKELKEEIGIETKLTEFKMFTLEEEDCVVYTGIYDGTFDLDPNEVDSIIPLSKDELLQSIASGKPIHPEFEFFIKTHVM